MRPETIASRNARPASGRCRQSDYVDDRSGAARMGCSCVKVEEAGRGPTRKASTGQGLSLRQERESTLWAKE
jgi:hypothetical protein